MVLQRRETVGDPDYLLNMKIRALTVITVLATVASCDLFSPQEDQVRLQDEFSTSRSVFDIPTYGSQGVTDSTMDHVATVMAEYLDSNEDGTPNDARIVDQLQGTAAMVITDHGYAVVYPTVLRAILENASVN